MSPIAIPPLNFTLTLPFIFLAGLVDSIAGGGGLISLPAYVAAGLPMHSALATNKFSSSCGTVFSTLRYRRAGMIDLPLALTGATLALFGSRLGSKAALLSSPVFLQKLLLVAIPLIVVLTLVKKDIGSENRSAELRKGLKFGLGALAGLLIGFWDGFFGPGTGTFLILAFTLLLRHDLVTANANAKVVNLASNLAALATFLWAGKVWFPLAVPAALCGISGNLLGSRLVIKSGNRVVRPFVILALILLLGRIAWDHLPALLFRNKPRHHTHAKTLKP